MNNHNKKALIITAFYSYDLDVRLNVLEEVLLSCGYQTTIVSSNFDHRKKDFIASPKDNVIFLPTLTYKKNLSIKRIKSHILFSRAIFEYINDNDYDLIYAITPPNTLFSVLASFKKKEPMTTVVCEIEDLWPESLPISSFIKFFLSPFFWYWSNKRNKSLKEFDALVFECYLHMNYIIKNNSSLKCRIARLGKNLSFFHECRNNITETINFLYLGSINNLIDYEIIVSFLKSVLQYRNVFLNIIGGGEHTKEFEDLLVKENIPFNNYGIVFDDDIKSDIISRCHFGLNIMKKSVFVGVTMKSLDYFSFGLPIVNNITGDTFDLINDFECGVNLDSKNIFSAAKIVGNLDEKEYRIMAEKSQHVYDLMFSRKAVSEQLKTIIKELEGD